MPFRRARLALAGLVALALGLAPAAAVAQSFTKPVRVIVPFAPGGTSDILARLIGPKLQEALGQPVVVENKTGAGGNIGADFVAKADKDGHTLLLLDVSTLAISPNLLASMTYSPTKDLAPVGLISFAPYVLAVHPSVPVKTVAELVAHAKANPGKVPFGNAGIGVANHISAVQLERTWGVTFKHVPYRGGADAIKGTVSGESQVILNGATATASFVSQGQLKGSPSPATGASRASRTCRPSRSSASPRPMSAPGRGCSPPRARPRPWWIASTPSSTRSSPCRMLPSGSRTSAPS